MNRAVFHERLKQMRFEEAYEGFLKKRLSQEEAASLLSVCSRRFRRYIHRYEESGLEGLCDKRMNTLSARCAPVDEVMAFNLHRVVSCINLTADSRPDFYIPKSLTSI